MHASVEPGLNDKKDAHTPEVLASTFPMSWPTPLMIALPSPLGG